MTFPYFSISFVNSHAHKTLLNFLLTSNKFSTVSHYVKKQLLLHFTENAFAQLVCMTSMILFNTWKWKRQKIFNYTMKRNYYARQRKRLVNRIPFNHQACNMLSRGSELNPGISKAATKIVYELTMEYKMKPRILKLP